MEQLSLFEASEYQVVFDVVELDSDGEILVDETGIILNGFRVKLNFEQLIKYYAKSYKVERLNYGYKFYYSECKRHYQIYARFGNMTTRKNEDIIDFMRRGFEWEEFDLWKQFEKGGCD